MKKSAQDREIEKLKKQVENSRKRKNLFKETNAISREGCPLLSQTMPSIVLYSKKEKPNVGLDKETFERMMNLLDDIITPV